MLDTAPTGHLLRLLEMPGLALGWCHALMRMLLKYREIVPLGTLAEELLGLARRIRALRERLADPGSTWLLVVALPESLSVPETARLLAGVRGAGVPPGALLVNRLWEGSSEIQAQRELRAAELIALDTSLPSAAAPELAPPPVGTDALLRFLDAWRTIEVRIHDA